MVCVSENECLACGRVGDVLYVQGTAVNRASRPGETHSRHGQAEQQAQAGGAGGLEAEHRVLRLRSTYILILTLSCKSFE